MTHAMSVAQLCRPSLNWLLAFIPIAAYCEYGTSNHTAIFITSCLAIIPIAGWMGEATEHLAEKTGEGIGGLLNATFGNAAELVIALVALSKGPAMYDVVKASITGSIIGNILLVLGAACLAGGVKFNVLKFSGPAVRSYSSMLFLAAAALVLPAVFHFVGGAGIEIRERDLSLEISVVMMITYILSLWFSLKTHKELFCGPAAESAAVSDDDHEKGNHKPWSTGKSIGVLVGATLLIATVAEWMVGSVEIAAHSLGMSNIFVGIVVVAIVGNAAEHSTAIMVARKNRMDLAMGVAIGSSIQIALFVAPVLVFASYAFNPGHPLDLVFSPMEVIAVVLAVLVVEQVTADGETHWLEGVQLLSVYLILALVFYLLPDQASAPHVGH
jgi:Ca2+:H+ antiporter